MRHEATKVRNLRVTYPLETGARENETASVEFRKHNDKCRALIGTEYSPVTVARFDRVVRYLSEYMEAFYRHDDTPLREVDHEFVTGFEHF